MSIVRFSSEPTLRCSLLDIDLPFLKVLPDKLVSAPEHSLEISVDGDFFYLKATKVRMEPEGACWMRILDDEVKANALERSFLDRGSKLVSEERRYTDRIRKSFKVTSPDLPGLEGTTYDVSSTGLRIITKQPVEVGKKLYLLLQGRESYGTNVVLGEAVWATEQDKSLFHVGVRFLKNMRN